MRRFRKRQIHKLFKDKATIEEESFIRNQKRALGSLKKLAERLRGSKVTLPGRYDEEINCNEDGSQKNLSNLSIASSSMLDHKIEVELE